MLIPSCTHLVLFNNFKLTVLGHFSPNAQLKNESNANAIINFVLLRVIGPGILSFSIFLGKLSILSTGLGFISIFSTFFGKTSISFSRDHFLFPEDKVNLWRA